jgi:ATP-binding cassette subfamily B (MDR/TAP) protein 1
VIVTGCNGAIMPVFALLLSRIINVFYNPDLHEMKKKADFWAGMFLMLAILSYVLLYCQYALFGVMGERLIRRVRHLTFKAVLRQDVAW